MLGKAFTFTGDVRQQYGREQNPEDVSDGLSVMQRTGIHLQAPRVS